MLTKYLNQLLEGNDLSGEDMCRAMELIFSGDVLHSQIGAFLAALRMKGESVEELAAAATVMRRHAVFIDTGCADAIDTCGTGGDGGKTFNISTAAAFVAAGAGAVVAKHGNRAVSGKCGSADVLCALGFQLDTPAERMEESIQSDGIGFLFAPVMHPAMKSIGVIRRGLKVRTIFNLLGPLTNPGGVSRQVIGVFAPTITEKFARVLKISGSKHVMVVHSADGLDEIGVSATTRVSELRDGVVKTYELFPEMVLGRTYRAEEIAGGDVEENARILKAVLSGKERGARRAITLVNAAAALVVAGRAATLQRGLKLAEQSVDSGAAMDKLQRLIANSRGK